MRFSVKHSEEQLRYFIELVVFVLLFCCFYALTLPKNLTMNKTCLSIKDFNQVFLVFLFKTPITRNADNSK